MYKLLHLVFVVLTIFFANVASCYAYTIFQDDFSNKNENIWDYNYNSGTIGFSDGAMTLGSGYFKFPYVINKSDNIIPQTENFDLNIKFKYTTDGNMGDGIGIGFTNSYGAFFYQFGIWRDHFNGSLFYYNDFSSSSQGECNNFEKANDLSGRRYFPISLGFSDWHILQIKKIGTNYRIYIDPDINLDPIYSTPDNQCTPKHIWFGNKGSGGGTDWNNISINDLRINIGQERNKIIILPGLGASWNTNAMVYNNSVAPTDWKMTPFVNSYDGLISTLDGNGLIRNKDYYVWNYDWRKPLNETVSDFNNYVNSIGADNIDLVGHSLGGVIARIWKQDQINNGRQINVYTLGSPNNGSVDAYSAWSGGKLSASSPSIESVAMNILLQLNKINGLSSFRKSTPVLKDLLPTYDFVKKQNKIISNNSLVSQNIFLNQKNNEAKNLTLNLNSYLGVGEKTKEYIYLTNNTVFDNKLGLWPDGKMINYAYNDGDGVVLKKNANLNINSNITEIKSDHGDIVNKSLSYLTSKLNLENKGNFISNDFSDSLVFFVGSPVNYSVVCDNNSPVSDIDGFVIIKNNNYRKCTMNLTGTGNGVYHLVYGNTNLSSDNWHYIESAVQTNEKVLINFNPKNGEIIKDNSNVSFIHKLITDELNLLIDKYGNNVYLTNSLRLLSVNDVNGIINNIFLFRKMTKENNLTLNVLDNLEMLSEIIYSNNNVSAQNDYLRALQNRSLINKITQLYFIRDIKPNEFSSLSYIKANDLLDTANFKLNIKDYTSASANSNLSEKFLKEVW